MDSLRLLVQAETLSILKYKCGSRKTWILSALESDADAVDSQLLLWLLESGVADPSQLLLWSPEAVGAGWTSLDPENKMLIRDLLLAD